MHGLSVHIVSGIYPLHNGSFACSGFLTASQQSQMTNATDSDIERVGGPLFTLKWLYTNSIRS